MAVPKKKISYSKTRKKFLVKKLFFTSYVNCNVCFNFHKLHSICFMCFHKVIIGKQRKFKFFLKFTNRSITNINDFYYKKVKKNN
jgi:ribosomal protein L32